MVSQSIIKSSNTVFAKTHDEGLVCVFAGATSGTGAGTLLNMAVTLQHSPTFYIIGRSATRFAAQRKKLESANSSVKIVFIEAEISLLHDVDRISAQITKNEKKVDFLFMSSGMIPFNKPECKSLPTSPYQSKH